MSKPLKYRKHSIIVLLVLLISFASIASAQADMTPAKQTAIDYIEANKGLMSDIALEIWDLAEVALKEVDSSALLASELAKEGFTVEIGVAGLPTAFVATWGSGKPVIGILAEYDALPGLSNVTVGAPGHGCGHNLFGTASVFAGIALKEAMETYGISGTIKVFGCPAEETVYGKVVMAGAGLFNGLDACINWHPGASNTVDYSSCNAIDNKYYRFYGVTAHAGAAPWLGKSAFDAMTLLIDSFEHMREHFYSEKERIHYVITKGGEAPNIVPDFCELWVFIRSNDMKNWESLSKWADLQAIGAATATGTKFEIERSAGAHLLLPNKVLALVQQANLELVGAPKFTAEELGYIKTELTKPYTTLDEKITPASGWEPGKSWTGGTYSTDVGDVSWITPTVGLSVTCYAVGTPGHHKDLTEQVGMSIGLKGMIAAAKVLACTGLDLFTSPDTIKKAWDEFGERKKALGWEYKTYGPGKLEYPEYKPKPTEIPIPTEPETFFPLPPKKLPKTEVGTEIVMFSLTQEPAAVSSTYTLAIATLVIGAIIGTASTAIGKRRKGGS